MANELMGDLMGEDFDMVGDEGGDDMGAAPGLRLARPQGRGRTLQLPPRAAWRNQLAPGVPVPGETMEPLPLAPQSNNGVFSAGVNQITFFARPQRPFRGERIVATVFRNGASATATPIVAGGLVVGTQVQSVEIGNLPLEIFSPSAFGVRLSLAAADPGVLISANVQLFGTPLVAPDTIGVTITILGRSIRG